jgi:hypothetical protein
MPVELAVKQTTDVAQKSVKEGVNLVKKAWSIMEAASEKKTPQEYLSPKAISSIQGK